MGGVGGTGTGKDSARYPRSVRTLQHGIVVLFGVCMLFVVMGVVLMQGVSTEHVERQVVVQEPQTKQFSVVPDNVPDSTNPPPQQDIMTEDVKEPVVEEPPPQDSGSQEFSEALKTFEQSHTEMCANEKSIPKAKYGSLRKFYRNQNINEAEIFTFRKPEFDNSTLVYYEGEYRVSYMAWISIIPHGHVVDKGGVYNCKVAFLPGGCTYERLPSTHMSPYIGGKRESHKKVAVLFQFWTTGYFHWMMEQMMRFWLMYDELIADPEIKIVITHGAWAKGYFDMIKFPMNRVINFRANVDIYAEKVYVPTPTLCGNPTGSLLQYAQKRVAEIVPTSPEYVNKRKHILIMKRKLGSRSIRNHDELVALVKRVFPDEDLVVFTVLGMYETANIFRNSKLILGPQGAGFSNLLFATPGTYVVQIAAGKGRVGINMCHLRAAEHFGMRHHVFVDMNATEQQAMTAPIADVEKLLRTFKL